MRFVVSIIRGAMCIGGVMFLYSSGSVAASVEKATFLCGVLGGREGGLLFGGSCVVVGSELSSIRSSLTSATTMGSALAMNPNLCVRVCVRERVDGFLATDPIVPVRLSPYLQSPSPRLQIRYFDHS